MDISALSGVEARLLLALLLGGEAMGARRLREVGSATGVGRHQTLAGAAQSLHRRGWVTLSYAGDGSALIALSPEFLSLVSLVCCTRSGVVDGATAGATAHGAVATSLGKDKVSNSNNTILTRPSFLATPTTQSVYPPSTQSVYPSDELASILDSEGSTESVGGVTESVYPKQKVFTPLNEKCLPPSQEPAEEETEEETEEEDGLDEGDRLWAAVEAADKLPTGESSHQRNSPFQRRRKAQLAALTSFWRHHLPAVAPLPDLLTRLLVAADNSASLVAETVEQVGAQVASGKQIAAPWGYIQAAIRNKRTQPRPASHATPELQEEIRPITPDFQAQLDDTKRIAAQLWG